MKAKKIFKQMIKEHNNGNEVTYVSLYSNIREVLKMLCGVPEFCIEGVDIQSSEWDGYTEAYLLTLSSDNLIWVQKAYFDDGRIAKGDGTYLIDMSAIGDNEPEDFIIGCGCKIKLIGGESND